jgi:threonine/homoserine/homoserine lactone efflux protein
MELSLFLSFCLASFLMALMPGPDNIFVMTESLVNGRKNALLIALGLNSGVLVHTLAAASGVSLILQQSSLAFHIIQYAGVAYLLYLAYGALQEKGEMPEGKHSSEKEAWNLYRKGVTMNLLNPKVSLFFIAFLPQFVSEGSWSPMLQMVLMGIAFMLIGLFTFSAFALLADQLRKPLMRPAFWKYLKLVKVLVLVLLATFLLIN